MKRERERNTSLQRSVHRCIGARPVLEDTSCLSSLEANGTPPTLSSLSNLFDPDRTCPCLYLRDSCPLPASPRPCLFQTPRPDLIRSLLGIFMVVASLMRVYAVVKPRSGRNDRFLPSLGVSSFVKLLCTWCDYRDSRTRKIIIPFAWRCCVWIFPT